MSIIPDPIATSIGRKILKSVNRDLCADVGVSSSKFAVSGVGVTVRGAANPVPAGVWLSVLFGFGVAVGLMVGIAVGMGFAVGVIVGLAEEIVNLSGTTAGEAALGLLSGAVGATACCLNW